MFTKFASTAILAVEKAPTDAAGLRRMAHRAVFEYEPRPGFIYIRSRAISSRCNDNFDEFPADEIKQSYMSFVGKPVFVNHNNDNHRRARGVIIDAKLHEDTAPDGRPDTWAEVLMEVDAVKFPKLAKAILAGHIDRTSMGTDVAFSVCSACGNKATTPMEYCAHIPRMKGQRIYRTTASGRKEGVLIREICHGLKFFENSLLVEEPADPTAFFTGVEVGPGVKTAGFFNRNKLPMAGEGINPSDPRFEQVPKQPATWRDAPDGPRGMQEPIGRCQGPCNRLMDMTGRMDDQRCDDCREGREVPKSHPTNGGGSKQNFWTDPGNPLSWHYSAKEAMWPFGKAPVDDGMGQGLCSDCHHDNSRHYNQGGDVMKCGKCSCATSRNAAPQPQPQRTASSDPMHPENHLFAPVNRDFPVCTKCNFEEHWHPHMHQGNNAVHCSTPDCDRDMSHYLHDKGKYEHLTVRDNPVPDDPSSMWRMQSKTAALTPISQCKSCGSASGEHCNCEGSVRLHQNKPDEPQRNDAGGSAGLPGWMTGKYEPISQCKSCSAPKGQDCRSGCNGTRLYKNVKNKFQRWVTRNAIKEAVLADPYGDKISVEATATEDEVNAWKQNNTVHHQNILDMWDKATDSEKDSGMRWYHDAHHVAKAIAGGDAAKGAGVLSAYSARQDWPANLFHASRSLREGTPSTNTPEVGGVMNSTHGKPAQRIMDGEHHSQVLGGSKTRAFAHLIEHGGRDPQTGDLDMHNVCVDTHALSVATGNRQNSKSAIQSGIFNKRRKKNNGLNPHYEDVADAYRTAARILSEKHGTTIAPHQVQAATWLAQKRQNDENASAAGNTDPNAMREKSRQQNSQNNLKEWRNYHSENYPDQATPEGHGFGMHAQKLAYGETIAPKDVDTLRDEECPVCAEKDSYDGNECSVCGFVKPPSMFLDPNLDMAKQLDLRKDQNQQPGGPPAQDQNPLTPGGNQATPDPNAVDAQGMPNEVPGSAQPGSDQVNIPQDPNAVDAQGMPTSAPGQPDLLDPYGDAPEQGLNGQVPGQEILVPDDKIDPQTGQPLIDGNTGLPEIGVPGLPDQGQQTPTDIYGQPLGPTGPSTPGDAPVPTDPGTGLPVDPVTGQPTDRQPVGPDVQQAPQMQQQGPVAPDGQPYDLETEQNDAATLQCPVCGFTTQAAPPMSVSTEAPMGGTNDLSDGAQEGDICPQCGQGLLTASVQGQNPQMQQGQDPNAFTRGAPSSWAGGGVPGGPGGGGSGGPGGQQGPSGAPGQDNDEEPAPEDDDPYGDDDHSQDNPFGMGSDEPDEDEDDQNNH
jgi:hypothetical protein